MPSQAQVDAIQSDVKTDDELESLSAVRSNRVIAMEQIEQANLRRMEEESGIKLESDEPNVDAQIEEQLAPEVPESKVRTVKIDGEERTVSDDELIRSYQKNQAADRRLEEAAQLLREANARAEQLAAQVQSQTQEPAPVSDDMRSEVKNALAVIYGGDEDAAAEALTNLLVKTRGGDQPTPPQPQLSVDELAVAVQQRLDVDTAFAKIQSDYPDLIADSNLEMLTAMKINQLAATGIPRAQAMLSAADEIYASLGKQPAGRQAPEPKPERNSRLENKGKLDPVRAASSSAIPPNVAAEEANPSSVIQEMAARRLGQSLQRAG